MKIDVEIDELLTPRQEVVLRRRIKQGQTLDAVGQHFSLTRERVRQIEKTALTILANTYLAAMERIYEEDRNAV